MRISIITQYFPEEKGAAAERMRSFADFFSKHFDLRVITSVPQHVVLKNDIKIDKTSYEVERLELKRKPSKGKYQRLIYEIAFSLKVAVLLMKRSDDSILLFTTPSPFLAIVALVLQKVKMKDYILDIRDLYPEVIADAGILKRSNPIYKLAENMMRRAYNNAQILTYVNEQWSAHMESVSSTAMFLPNGISTSITKQVPKKEREDLVIYSGNYGRMYNFDPLLELAERFQRHEDKRLSRIEFLLIGDGIQSNYLQEQIEERQLKNTKMTGPFSQDEVRLILQRGKIGIVSLNLEADSLRGAVPNKLFDYMEAGLKTIALLPQTLSPEIMSTGLISLYTDIDYKKLVDDVSNSILNYKHVGISRDLFPFLYREYHLKKLLEEIHRRNYLE